MRWVAPRYCRPLPRLAGGEGKFSLRAERLEPFSLVVDDVEERLTHDEAAAVFKDDHLPFPAIGSAQDREMA